MNKEWILVCPDVEYTIQRQCARAIPAIMLPRAYGDPVTVKLLDDVEINAEGPAVRDWNPMDGI